MAKKNSYLGIDLGSGGIKIVELENVKGSANLVTYGYSENPGGLAKSLVNQDPAELGELLKLVAAKAKVRTVRSVTALPTFSVFSSIISLTDVKAKELTNAIRIEAKKVIPLPIEEMILDWKIVIEEKGSGTKAVANDSGEPAISVKSANVTKVLLTAASKDLVSKYVDIFKAAGFVLLSLETEAFALTRSLVGSEKSVAMIVDMGASTTNISVIDHGIPVLNRGVNLGGLATSKIISQSLKIDLVQAEQFKKDWSKIIPAGEVPESVKAGLAPLLNEVKYIFNFYQSQNRTMGLAAGQVGKIEKIILTGGSAVIPMLDELLSKLLNVKVFVGDPWASVTYPMELKDVLTEIGPSLSVAAGLALRYIE